MENEKMLETLIDMEGDIEALRDLVNCLKEENLTDADFDHYQMLTVIGMCMEQVYGKVKALTDQADRMALEDEQVLNH